MFSLCFVDSLLKSENLRDMAILQYTIYCGVKKCFISSCNWTDKNQSCNENVFMYSVLFLPRSIDF